MAQKTTGPDQRRSPRLWVKRRGELIIVRSLKATSTIACKVLNTSKGGALIKVDCAAADIPDDFYLSIAGQPERTLVCSVVRRGRQLLGVRFVAQPDYEVRLLGSYVS